MKYFICWGVFSLEVGFMVINIDFDCDINFECGVLILEMTTGFWWN